MATNRASTATSWTPMAMSATTSRSAQKATANVDRNTVSVLPLRMTSIYAMARVAATDHIR